MFVNFCDACLRTDVSCSTVSTEGYEVTNLVNNSDKGFLAYSAIKPPVVIDFVFICNIQVSHVIVWPQIGAQKSTGFQLSVKSSDNKNEPFIDVSKVFLEKEQFGILFHRRDIPYHTDIPLPPNFTERYIKAISEINYTSRLRISILKTDNSVPALKQIQIWGRVSPKCGKDVAMNVTALWMNRFNNISVSKVSSCENEDTKKEKNERQKTYSNILNVPEDFLDPITLEIMTQPIILPSGKIIDQKTLGKHAQSEGVWGRPASDPFTGIRFSEVNRPITAFPLKARIDKFLLEHSNEEEIKKLPRVLGSKAEQSKSVNVITCVPDSSRNNLSVVKKNNQLKRTLERENSTNNVKKSFHGHLLPVVSLRNSRSDYKTTADKVPSSSISSNKNSSKEINKRNSAIEERLNSNIQAANMPTCKCCADKIFYKLPCEHVICRKALLLLENNVCTICKLEFKKSDPQRFHLCN